MIKSLTLHEIIAECGDFEEGDRIKHDRCYCESRFTFNETTLQYFEYFDTEEINKELAPFNETFESLKGRTFVIYGSSTYYDGAEWDPEIYEVIESENPLVLYFDAMIKKYNLLNEPMLLAVNKESLAIDAKEFLNKLKKLPKVSEEH